ncbi:uncharacterized protein N7477_000248 [Penicillium maclennaniae]|uniref:uncharacterized protein n=1 Tax=Penicillium maclennaniae TaxID=1343394 RepID=UPI00253FF7EC|nr:uncharacterized protein N7477_000248 [Penicillium maclennaniae]KAJ5683903.1 hypothetical protein N7477_000248 [Penicillium maclennaniae]
MAIEQYVLSDALEVPEIKTRLIAEPQQKMTEKQGIMMGLRRKASRFLKGTDIAKLQIAKSAKVALYGEAETKFEL